MLLKTAIINEADYCELDDFHEVLSLLLKRDQGLIMLTGHYGNWEILGYVLATLGFHTTSIARPMDNPYVNDWLLGVREKKGQKIIAKKGATEEVDRLLIHEFGHEASGDHLSEDYHDALCRLGAGMKRLAMEKPDELRRFIPK